MENVIELNKVTKAFEGFKLENLSMTVKKGFITGFIGGNGAGKSTTIKLIMNLLQPDRGDISLFGLDYKNHEKEIKQRIGFVFDNNIFIENVVTVCRKGTCTKASCSASMIPMHSHETGLVVSSCRRRLLVRVKREASR